MKVIDEKGRLFGKVNIIDLLVVLLVIAAAAFLVLRHFSNTDAGEETPEETINVTYQVQVARVEPVIYETVEKQMEGAEDGRLQLYSSDTDKFLDAYIVNFETKPHVEYVITDQGEVKRVESSGEDKRMDVVFTIEAETTNPNTHAVSNQHLRVGLGHYLKTTFFEFYGTIISIEVEGETA